ncbi:MAG: phage protease [Sphingomonas sp.]
MGGVTKLPENTAYASAIEVATGDKRIQLFAMGRHVGRDGRGPYELRDLAHAEAVIATTRRQQGSTDIAIDYDHQSVFAVSPAIGGTAVAAGWIKPANLVADDAGIWAENVEWTAAATQRLDAREYRYISPYFGFAKDGALTRIINAALVNRPNLDLAAVAAELPGDSQDMNELEKIALALGLVATASATDIVSAIGELSNAKKTLLATASALGLGADASAEQFATAASTLKTRADAGPDITKFVPVEQVEPLVAKLARIDEERATAAVDAATRTGKLAPSLREWGLAEFKRDETAFAAYIEKAPVILKPGAELDGPRDPAKPFTALTAAEELACAAMGMEPADYLVMKNEELTNVVR